MRSPAPPDCTIQDIIIVPTRFLPPYIQSESTSLSCLYYTRHHHRYIESEHQPLLSVLHKTSSLFLPGTYSQSTSPSCLYYTRHHHCSYHQLHTVRSPAPPDCTIQDIIIVPTRFLPPYIQSESTSLSCLYYTRHHHRYIESEHQPLLSVLHKTSSLFLPGTYSQSTSPSCLYYTRHHHCSYHQLHTVRSPAPPDCTIQDIIIVPTRFLPPYIQSESTSLSCLYYTRHHHRYI